MRRVRWTPRLACALFVIALVAIALLVVPARVVSAQTMSRVAGRVVRPGGDSIVGVANTWVTIHRVAPDSAAPIDSTRTSATGAYAFTYRRWGSDEAIYFASSSHGGVAYFTPPLAPGNVTGDDAEITVFDTTSHAVPIVIRGRHLIVQRPGEGGARIVTEVYEISNDSSVTRVARSDDAAGAVWSASLPPGATAPAVGEGDIPSQAVRFASGRALLFAPLPPGIRQLAFHYTLGAGDFPLKIPVERATQVLEVLVEERDARVDGARVREVAPVAVSGRTLRRFLAQDVPANAVLTVQVDAPARPYALWFAAGLTLVIGGAMTWALARTLRRR